MRQARGAFFESTFVPYALVSSESGDRAPSPAITSRSCAQPRARRDDRFPCSACRRPGVVDLGPGWRASGATCGCAGRLEGRRLVPYYSRAEIDARGEGFRAPVIAGRPIDRAFFLQIQGSGQLELESGERMRLAYAIRNGHPYRSLGRYLVERGELTSRAGLDAGHQELGGGESAEAAGRAQRETRATCSFASRPIRASRAARSACRSCRNTAWRLTGASYRSVRRFSRHELSLVGGTAHPPRRGARHRRRDPRRGARRLLLGNGAEAASRPAHAPERQDVALLAARRGAAAQRLGFYVKASR